jgi:Tol biopolymer transport system component
VRGEPFSVVEELAVRVSYQVRVFATGGTTLAYVPNSANLSHGTLIWLDRRGEETPIADLAGVLDMPRLSRGGDRVAFRSAAPECDVWVHDLETGTTSRVTLEGDNHGTVWSADDESIVVARNEEPGWSVLALAADGVGRSERLALALGPRVMTSSASADGRYVLVSSRQAETGADVDLLDSSDGTVRPLFGTRFEEDAGSFSPDGLLVAYSSNESGLSQVYVQTFPGLDQKQQVSVHGGGEPVWSPQGNELFFRLQEKVMVASVVGRDPIRFSPPSLLFEGPWIRSSGFNLPSYDVSADGERFIMIRQRGVSSGEMHVVVGWLDELERLAASRGSE